MKKIAAYLLFLFPILVTLESSACGTSSLVFEESEYFPETTANEANSDSSQDDGDDTDCLMPDQHGSSACYRQACFHSCQQQQNCASFINSVFKIRAPPLH